MRLKPSQESLPRQAEPEESSGGRPPASASEASASEASTEDGLDALASELRSDESGEAREPPDELDDELDLAKLAAVTGARSPTAQEEPVAAVTREAPTAERRSSKVVPALVGLALGLGVLGFVLGRTSREPTSASPAPAALAVAPQVAPPVIAPVAAAQKVVQAAPQAAPQAEPQAVLTRPAEKAQAPSLPAGDASDRSRVRAPVAPAADSPAIKGPPAAAPAASDRSDAPVLRVQASAAPAPVAAKGAASEAEPQTPFDLETAALAAVEASRPSGNRPVDVLLNEALDPAARKQREQQEPAEATLPEAPSREEVTQTMAVLLPAIRGCAMGQTGVAAAGIVVRGDGRVASVELSGAPFAGTASGRCMEGVIRRARFSRFRQPTFRVRLPFAIQ